MARKTMASAAHRNEQIIARAYSMAWKTIVAGASRNDRWTKIHSVIPNPPQFFIARVVGKDYFATGGQRRIWLEPKP